MGNARKISELLDLDKEPVSVKFMDTAPEGLERIEEPAASGCTYWKFASQGRAFYTEAADHYGCPVGSHTHGIDLPDETAQELEGLIGTMVQLEYLDMEEVPGIPQRQGEFGVCVYAPANESDVDPDAVIVCGNARQMMLLAEAANLAGVASDSSMVGRPTCAAIPAVMQSGRTATNLGCIGNRVYTELADDELYFVISGAQVQSVADKLATIVDANDQLQTFHSQRIS